MQIKLSSSAFPVLACIILVANVEEASALPAQLPSVVTLPLRSLSEESDLHPQVVSLS